MNKPLAHQYKTSMKKKRIEGKEVIKHAAVREGEFFFIGRSHADCFHQASGCGLRLMGRAADQGFFTNKGRYVNRVKAAQIAVRAGQVPKGTKVLCSEDLWSPVHKGKFNYDSVKGYYPKDKVQIWDRF